VEKVTTIWAKKLGFSKGLNNWGLSIWGFFDSSSGKHKTCPWNSLLDRALYIILSKMIDSLRNLVNHFLHSIKLCKSRNIFLRTFVWGQKSSKLGRVDKCQIIVIFYSTYRLVLQVIQYKIPQFYINIVYICKFVRKLLRLFSILFFIAFEHDYTNTEQKKANTRAKS